MSQGSSDVRFETNFMTLAFCAMMLLFGVAAVVGDWSSGPVGAGGPQANVDSADRRERERLEYLSQADARRAAAIRERWREDERRRV